MSCGCLQKERVSSALKAKYGLHRLAMIGRQFGRLVVESIVDFKSGDHVFYRCRCTCGNVTEVIGYSLTNNDTTSCGCFNKERTSICSTTHGLRHHPLYNVWNLMIQRCYNRHNPKYEYWGGRGIYICDEWRHDFKVFYNWAMSHGYKPGLTIDRYPNNDDGCAPSNCRWATREEQARNKRSTKLNLDKVRVIRSDNRTHLEIAIDYGVSETTIRDVKSNKIWKDDVGCC